MKTTTFRVPAALLLLGALAAGCASKKGPAGVDEDAVVARVGDREITVGDWLTQVDLYRVFSLQPVDPSDPEHQREVLQSLLDQQIVLQALRKADYSDPKFDKEIKEELVQAEQRLKEIREKLQQDMAAVERLERNFKEEYTKMRLAQHFAESKVGDFIVTEKEMRDRYADYVKQAKEANQKPRPYDQVRQLIKLRLQTDKMIESLRGDLPVERDEEVIRKYLERLSPSRKALEEGGK